MVLMLEGEREGRPIPETVCENPAKAPGKVEVPNVLIQAPICVVATVGDLSGLLARIIPIRRAHRPADRLPHAMPKRTNASLAAADAEFTGFRPAALDFFRTLRRNNRREWFEANRPLYEREVLGPLRALVEEMDARLARFAPEIVGQPRRSIFRIHRDVRFSKDKTPYKTNAACWFFHQDAGRAVGVGSGPDGGAAGFYLGLSPGDSMLGGGVWMPPRPALARIRAALVERSEELESIVRARGFRARFGELDEERMLTRVPRGFRPDSPAAPWLRYVSFTATRPLTDDELLRPDLAARLEKDYRALVPFVRWLNRALGFSPTARRI